MVSRGRQNHKVPVRPQPGTTGAGVSIPPRQEHKF